MKRATEALARAIFLVVSAGLAYLIVHGLGMLLED